MEQNFLAELKRFRILNNKTITERRRFSAEAGEVLMGEVDMIFVATDPRGYEIHLTNDCWHNHILVQHPILLWKKP